MASVRLSLPQELKDRMDKLDNKMRPLKVNWSQVAQEAFKEVIKKEENKISEDAKQ